VGDDAVGLDGRPLRVDIEQTAGEVIILPNTFRIALMLMKGMFAPSSGCLLRSSALRFYRL